MKHRNKRGRRTRQPDAALDPFSARSMMVCREARDALALALADAHDPHLHCARVLDVFPDPDLSRLRAHIGAPKRDCADLLRALERAHAYLRFAAMAELERKHTPDLSFTVVPDDALEDAP